VACIHATPISPVCLSLRDLEGQQYRHVLSSKKVIGCSKS
jgi:hypothetical protein